MNNTKRAPRRPANPRPATNTDLAIGVLVLLAIALLAALILPH